MRGTGTLPWLTVLLCGLALTGCSPALQAPTTWPTPLAENPTGPDVAALREQARQLATDLGARPSDIGPPGLHIVGIAPEGLGPAPEGRLRVRRPSTLRIAPGETPVPVEAFEHTFVGRPWAEISPSGVLTVRWETAEPAPAGMLYYGMRFESDPLSPPRFRKSKVERIDGVTHIHGIGARLQGLLAPRYDVVGVKERGYGELIWRVATAHPRLPTRVFHDGRTAFSLDDQGAFHQQPTVVVGPLLSWRDATTAIVVLETDVPVAAALGVSGRPVVTSPTVGTRHELAIPGLEAEGTYRYSVAISDGVQTSNTPPRVFRWLPVDGPLTLGIMSDSRAGSGPGLSAHNGVNVDILQRLVTGSYRQGAQLLLFPGDLIDGYTTSAEVFHSQLTTWLQAVEGVGGVVPILTGMGNHEALLRAWSDGMVADKTGDGSSESAFADRMANPTNGPPPEGQDAPTYGENVYSLDVSGVHLVMLNTNYWFTNRLGDPRIEGGGNREGFLMDGQLRWLEDDLAAARARGVRHIVVMGHEPGFPVGGHTKDAMWYHGKIPEVNAMRERFWKLLAHHGVLAYVSGDEHNYSRSLIGPETVSGAERSVWSIITGGCGAPYYGLEPPEEYRTRVRAFSAEQHSTLWRFEGDRVTLQVRGVTGGLIEEVVLTDEPEVGLPTP